MGTEDKSFQGGAKVEASWQEVGGLTPREESRRRRWTATTLIQLDLDDTFLGKITWQSGNKDAKAIQEYSYYDNDMKSLG